ncbi:hypothetical protein FJW07_29910 [Mesorhizobium sp. B3-1-9]|uniref:hypothetical protein n=1 Tax=Mesorhizobium sp. B3-1-9 TaxID=2589892 RepID=UPI0011295E0A|nr:hypothetical protein [Mesorhizobium sp. B3-1-9]TPI30008.1 hypothetical protein FJW07_29910 [Mesorhizobium sp. B3-1-9]
MRKLTLAGAFLLLVVYAGITPSLAEETLQPNMDFAKSPCVEKGKHGTKGIVARVFPKLGDNNQLQLVDDRTSWEQNFPTLSTDKSIEFLMAGVYDAWAIYYTMEDKKGLIRGFTVQYAFGDLASKFAPRCLVFPDAPERTNVDKMAPIAVQLYLAGLKKKDSGTLEEMKARLKKLVKER